MSKLDEIRNPEDWLETVRRHVVRLRFGVVQIIVHEGKVVQTEKTEKIRFAAGAKTLSHETLPTSSSGGLIKTH